MSTIQTTFTSNDSSVQKAIGLMQTRMDQLVEKQKKLADAAKQGGRTAVKAFQDNEKAIYNLQLQSLRLQAQEERRTAAEKRSAEESKRRMEELGRKQEEQHRKRQQENTTLRQMVAGQIADLKSMVMQYGSVAAAVGVVVGAYREWRQEIERLGAASDKLNKDTLKDLALGGDLENAPAFLKAQQKHPTATPEQWAAARRGVREASPTMADARVIDIANEAARVAPLVQNDPAAIQALAAAASEIADTLPDLKPADAVDLALSLSPTDLAKVASPEFQRATKIFRETGAADAPEALALGAEVLDANLDPKSLEKLASKLTEKTKLPPLPAGRALNENEKLFRAFAKEQDAAKRLEMLRSNEGLRQKVLGDQLANKFREIDFDKGFQRAQVLRDNMGRDFVGERLQLAGETAVGQEALATQKTARGTAEARREEEEYGRALQRAKDELARINLKDNTGIELIDAINNKAREWEFALRTWIPGNTPVEALRDTITPARIRGLPIPGDKSFLEDEETKAFVERERGISGKQAAERGDHELPESVERFMPFLLKKSFKWGRAAADWMFGEEKQTPIVEQPQPEAPPRPKIELPPEPPRREPRNPVPLGKTRQQLRDEFEQRKAGPRPAAADQAAVELPSVELLPPRDFPAQYQLPELELLPPKVRLAGGAEDLAIAPPRVKLPPAPAVDLDALEVNVPPAARLAMPAPKVSAPQVAMDPRRVDAPRMPRLELPPPRPEMEPLAMRPPRVELPDLVAGPRATREEGLGLAPRRSDLDLSSLADRGRREVESTEIKLPQLDRAPSIAEQFAGLAEQLASAGTSNSFDASKLWDLGRDVLAALTEGNANQKTNQRLLEQFAAGRQRPGITPAAGLARSFNDHFEPA